MNGLLATAAPLSSADIPMFPGGLWNGTAQSGGTPPAEDTTLRGSGWPQKAIGNFDEVPLVHFESPDLYWLTVLADHGDSEHIASVDVWL